MDSKQVPQDIINRIEKLMALRDNAGTPAESENAAMRISELLMKWNIEMEQLDFKTNATKKAITKETVDLNELQTKTEADWVVRLFGVIAQYNLCSVIRHVTKQKEYDQGYVAVIGKAHNIEIVNYTAIALIPKIRYAEKNTWGNYSGPEKRNTFKRGFLLGCIAGINAKLKEQQVAMQRESTSITALVQTNSLEIREFIQNQYHNLKSSKSTGTSSNHGKQMGFEAGKGMSLNKGIGNTNAAGQRLLN